MASQPDRPLLERGAIVGAAREMIRTGGLESLSLRRLAGKLGVTAAALYAHVDDKEDLLRAVAECEFEELLEAYEAVPAGTALERITAQARAYVDHARREPNLFRVMFLFPPGPLKAGASGTAELPGATAAFTIASSTVADAMEEGSIEKGDVFATTLVFWAAMHGVASILQLGIGLDAAAEEQLVAEVLDRLLAGYASPSK